MRCRRIIIFALALFAFGSSVVSSVAYNQRVNAEIAAYEIEQAENKANYGISFSGPYCYPDRHPRFLFFISAIIAIGGVLLIICKNAVWSFLAFIVAFTFFPLWYWTTQRSLGMAESVDWVVGIDKYLYKASVFDQFSLVLLLSIITIQST